MPFRQLYDATSSTYSYLLADPATRENDKPLVVVCQTGKRSALATVILRQAGLEQVANLAGGMVRWRELE